LTLVRITLNNELIWSLETCQTLSFSLRTVSKPITVRVDFRASDRSILKFLRLNIATCTIQLAVIHMSASPLPESGGRSNLDCYKVLFLSNYARFYVAIET